MKKIFVLLMSLVLITFSGCETLKITALDRVVIGYDENKVPDGGYYEDSVPCQWYILSACEELNWQPEFVGVNMSDVESLINSGSIDCYWNCYTYQSREDKFAWSDPYRESRLVLVLRSDDNMFDDLDGNINIEHVSSKAPKDAVIATSANTVTSRLMDEEQIKYIDSMGDFKEYSDLKACKAALDSGEADMVLTEIACSAPLFNHVEYSRIIFDPTDSNSYAVAFKKGREADAEKVTAALRKIYSEGIIEENIREYYGKNLIGAEDAIEIIKGDWLLK